MSFSWRDRTGRPPIQLDIFPASPDVWRFFKEHHYLSADLNRSASCYVAEVAGSPVAFLAVRYQPLSHTPGWMFHRVVTLPEWQGVGIGTKLIDHVARQFQARPPGRVRFPTRNPGLVRALERSALWRCVRPMGSTHRKPSLQGRKKAAITARMSQASARGEIIAVFEWVGP